MMDTFKETLRTLLLEARQRFDAIENPTDEDRAVFGMALEFINTLNTKYSEESL